MQLARDCVVVVRYQGPRANGMPELHQLTPALTSLQSKGFKVALVTDGRMSGASGAVPAAIHVTPECLAGGMLAKVRDGDVIRLDSYAGVLEVQVPDDVLRSANRPAAGPAPQRLRRRPRAVRARSAPPPAMRKPARSRACSPPSLLEATMNIRSILALAPVIPVLTIEHVDHAVPLARALCAGGLRVLEVTLRTPACLPAIEAMRRVGSRMRSSASARSRALRTSSLPSGPARSSA